MLEKIMKPERLRLSDSVRRSLKALGGRGIVIIEFDDAIGPIIKYYYNRRSRLVTELLSNSAFTVELAIAGKYAKEIILRDNTRVLLKEFKSKIDGRIGINYVVLEATANADIDALFKILEAIAKKITNEKKLTKSFLSRIIHEAISFAKHRNTKICVSK
ncbi:MAG: hypothetical protein ACTSX9_00845 [Candidatus Njordarchaeales archaeon]